MAKKKKKIDWKIGCVAILALTLIQIAAMHYGIDGVFRATITGIICLIVGVVLPNPFKS